jgi:hypothetical protein
MHLQHVGVLSKEKIGNDKNTKFTSIIDHKENVNLYR